MLRPEFQARLVGNFGDNQGKWVHGVAVGGGRAVFPPYNASDLLVVDGEVGTASLVDFDRGEVGTKWAFGVSVGNGRAVFAPIDARTAWRPSSAATTGGPFSRPTPPA